MVNSLAVFFRDVPDPRQEELVDHPLINILAIALLSQFCGAEGWEEMELWAKTRKEWLGTFLDLSEGVPSHDTIRRVMAALLPGPFRKAFIAYAKAIVETTQGKLVAVDGKTARGSARRSRDVPALHVVRAWVRDNHLVLGQLATQDTSNEITAIPELLDLLSLKGALITLDAMGAQTAIAEKILDKGADYVMAIKDNQPTVAAEIRNALGSLPEPPKASTHFRRTEDIGHGRHEVRRIWTAPVTNRLPACELWPAAETIIRVQSERETASGTTVEDRYYISSKNLTALAAARAIRGHWSVENNCHWTLDVAFGEDDSRIWDGHAPENLSQIRSLVMMALKKDTSRKLSMRKKLKLCAWDNNYLNHVLEGIFSL